MRRQRYYEELETEVIDTMKASMGVGGLCNVEICESLLSHIRECYTRFDDLLQLEKENILEEAKQARELAQVKALSATKPAPVEKAPEPLMEDTNAGPAPV